MSFFSCNRQPWESNDDFRIRSNVERLDFERAQERRREADRAWGDHLLNQRRQEEENRRAANLVAQAAAAEAAEKKAKEEAEKLAREVAELEALEQAEEEAQAQALAEVTTTHAQVVADATQELATEETRTQEQRTMAESAAEQVTQLEGLQTALTS